MLKLTMSPGFFICSIKKNYPKDSERSWPEILIKDFHNLTLSPSTKLPLPLPNGLPQGRNRRGTILKETTDGSHSRWERVQTLLWAQKYE